MPSFNKSRLTLARKFRKLTKLALAQKTGVTDRSITAYESGGSEPGDDKARTLASVLAFPLSFFYADDISEIPTEVISFRALSKTTAMDRDKTIVEGQFAKIVTEWLNNNFSLPDVDLPDLLSEVDSKKNIPEIAADSLRSYWGLGQLPIPNLLNLLESKGVMIFSLSSNHDGTDGFSFWDGGRPYILYDPMKTAERSRFDLAHELGHLILHRDKPVAILRKDKERDANQFASAFLMPLRGLLSKCPREITLQALINHKQYWNVSVAALNYRLHKIGKTTDWVFRTICTQISAYGRTREPYGLPPETSLIISKALEALRAEGKTIEDISDELRLNEHDIDSLLFGMLLQRKQGHLRILG